MFTKTENSELQQQLVVSSLSVNSEVRSLNLLLLYYILYSIVLIMVIGSLFTITFIKSNE
jgi:hypothetical protein